MFFLIFTGAAVLIWIGLLFVFVRPLHLKLPAAFALSLAMLAGLSKFALFRAFGGAAFCPDLPGWAIRAGGLFSGAMWILLGISTAAFVASGIWRICGGRVHSSRLPAMAQAAGAFATAGYGIWEGMRVPPVRRREIALEDLPPEFDGIKIAHLSDIHASPATRADKIAAIVERTNAEKPDFVCITGDFVDGSVPERLDDLRPLSRLSAPLGVFGCSGNHEYYSGYGEWIAALGTLGIRMLENRHAVLERGQGRIALGGVSDGAWARDSQRDLPAAFRGAPSGAFRILMEHRPVDCAANASAGVGLQLSGHTHGGAIIGIDRLFVAGANEGHLRGVYREGPLVLHVNPGTGQWAGFPMRIGIPAEITILVLRRGGAHPCQRSQSPSSRTADEFERNQT